MDTSSPGYLDEVGEQLYTSVLADVLDALGHRRQAMGPQVRPIWEGARIVGRAATILFTEVYEEPDDPYALELELLDSLVPGEVVVGTTQGSMCAAVWGELISTHARARGCRGAVFDGPTRDVWGITEMRFPTFASGTSPYDSKGRLDVVCYRRPIEVAGVEVRDGDLVVADVDGVVVVPAGAEEEAVRRALEKVSGENEVRDVLARGASIAQVFREYGVL